MARRGVLQTSRGLPTRQRSGAKQQCENAVQPRDVAPTHSNTPANGPLFALVRPKRASHCVQPRFLTLPTVAPLSRVSNDISPRSTLSRLSLSLSLLSLRTYAHALPVCNAPPLRPLIFVSLAGPSAIPQQEKSPLLSHKHGKQSHR